MTKPMATASKKRSLQSNPSAVPPKGKTAAVGRRRQTQPAQGEGKGASGCSSERPPLHPSLRSGKRRGKSAGAKSTADSSTTSGRVTIGDDDEAPRAGGEASAAAEALVDLSGKEGQGGEQDQNRVSPHRPLRATRGVRHPDGYFRSMNGTPDRQDKARTKSSSAVTTARRTATASSRSGVPAVSVGSTPTRASSRGLQSSRNLAALGDPNSEGDTDQEISQRRGKGDDDVEEEEEEDEDEDEEDEDEDEEDEDNRDEHDDGGQANVTQNSVSVFSFFFCAGIIGAHIHNSAPTTLPYTKEKRSDAQYKLVEC